MGFWPAIQALVKEADVILLVVDARVPELSKNRELEELITSKGKVQIVVFNKIDLVSSKDLTNLRKENQDCFFVSGNRNIGLKKLKTHLIIMSKRMHLKKTIKVGVVGYPNVGKSSIINAMAKSAKTEVSSTAGTTKRLKFVNAGGVKIIDSPGVIPFEDHEIKLSLISAKNPEKLKNPLGSAMEIVKLIIKRDKTILEKYYGIKIENEESYDVIYEIGKKRKFMLKGGIIDEHRTEMQIIRDWHNGNLRL